MPDMIVLLVIVLIVVLIWRGPKVLPEWGAALGKGIREARTHATKGLDDKDAAPPRLTDGGTDELTSTSARAETTHAPRS
jgi:Sec-independent protein translocase protein TatA